MVSLGNYYYSYNANFVPGILLCTNFKDFLTFLNKTLMLGKRDNPFFEPHQPEEDLFVQERQAHKLVKESQSRRNPKQLQAELLENLEVTL